MSLQIDWFLVVVVMLGAAASAAMLLLGRRNLANYSFAAHTRTSSISKVEIPTETPGTPV